MTKNNLHIFIFIFLISLYFYVFFYQIPYKKSIKNIFLNLNQYLNDHKTLNKNIPNQVYLMWHTTHLPFYMNQNVELLKRDNPDLHFHLYDLKKCREFIQNHYSPDTLMAFDKLKPYAYKSDLWRYCILYKKGGIYMDIKFTPIKENFELSSFLDKEYFCIDWSDKTTEEKIDYSCGICNGFIVCKPNNPIFKKCIDQIIDNIKNHYYGINSLYPTGPMLLNSYFTLFMKKKLELDLYKDKDNQITLRKQKKPIFKYYKEYREEQEKNTDIPHYGELWKNRDIYNI